MTFSRSKFLAALTVIGVVTGVLAVAQQPAVAATAPGAWIGMPFTDRWTINQRPNVHWAPNGGDWAVDLFGYSGTEVRVIVGDATGPISLYAQRSASCGGTGSRVLVTVRVGGVNVGWISYSHLDAAVPTGYIPNGAVIGRTRAWPYVAGCWEVSTPGGVHTHFEARNTTGYSCWTRHATGSPLSYGARIGRLGAPAASAPRTECPSSSSTWNLGPYAGTSVGARFVGDWDGNGTTTVGVVYRTPTGLQWHLRNGNSGGPASLIFNYGLPTDIPIVGNWDGVGGDTIGVARSAASGGLQWHLRNYNSAGPPSVVFFYGERTDMPVVGNWDGYGSDTIGVARPTASGLQWHLRNYNSGGSANMIFLYGNATDAPITGNWDGFRGDTVGITRVVSGGLQWHLRNYNSNGPASNVFWYGVSTDSAVVGNWDRAGGDTVGVVRRTSIGMQWHLRNYNSAGSAANVFYYGSGTLAIA